MKKSVQGLFVIFFIFLLCFPSIIMLTGISSGTSSNFENRTIVRQLALKGKKIAEWPSIIDKYLSDNIGFRSQVIRYYIRIWELKFRTNVRSNFFGTDGQFFPNWDVAPVVERYFGVQRLSRPDLFNIRATIMAYQLFWESNGAVYLWGIAPDKTAIFKDDLPTLLKNKPSMSVEEQLSSIIKNTPINYIDLTSVLDKANRKHPVFDKTFDIVHWNGYGLEAAYLKMSQDIARLTPHFSLQPGIKTYRIDIKNVPSELAKKERSAYFALEGEELLKISKTKYIPDHCCPGVFSRA